MNKKDFYFTDFTGICISAYKWFNESNTKPKAAVLIIHGMAEYAQRYDLFARVLVDAGYIVYAIDHRGHGKTAGSLENTGYFADSNGWNLVLDDIQQLKSLIFKENIDIPLFVFGHSMGSLILRNLMFKYPDGIHGIILSGTSYTPLNLVKLGKVIAYLQKFFLGKKHRSKLLDKLSFGSFNKKFKPAKTSFDWLNNDTSEVEKYIKDDYCGFVCTTQFYIDLFNGIKAVQNISNIKMVPGDMEVFIIAGTMDAVGDFTKGVVKVENLFNKAGLIHVSHKFYENARHELTNEPIKHKVYQDIIDWIEGIIEKAPL